MKKIKIAIYSRKSVFTGKGESIENQIQMCKNHYLKLYSHNNEEFEVYEDEGYTGANIKRPEFQRLLKDIKKNKISVLICYRIDRISRNVADFSSILELLQLHDVAFISIKEQFDTSTPMGKAMVYIASVFAQLERDTIAERIRDNMLELSKTGRWLGGQLPLGFKGEKITLIDSELKEHSMHKLTPIPEEISLINQIFKDYLTTNSIQYVLNVISINNQKGKNGGSLASSSIKDILRNPIYVKSNEEVRKYLENKNIIFYGIPNGCGIMIYNKRLAGKKLNPANKWIASIGLHEGIISAEDWLTVQKNLDSNEKKKLGNSIRLGTSKQALLTGLLKCSKCGSSMRVIYGRPRKDGTKNYYYMCTMKNQKNSNKCCNSNVNGILLEKSILKILINYNPRDLRKRLKLLLNKRTSSKISSNTITSQIESLTSEIDTLLNQLSKTTNTLTQQFILEKVNLLTKDMQNLKNCRKEKYQTDDKISFEIPKDFYSFIKNYAFDENPKESLKILLRKIIDKVTYDGETNTVTIYITNKNDCSIRNHACL